jgi:Ca2+-binding EF-hand superfamily protein
MLRTTIRDPRVKLCLRPQVPPEALMQVASKVQDQAGGTFSSLDKNADRIIEIEEFAVLMLEMNQKCTAAELRACFDTIDSDRDGRVTLEEFRAWQARGSGPAIEAR